MSFCTEVKNELVLVRSSVCCRYAFAYGFMLFGRSFSIKRIVLQTTNEVVAKAYGDTLKSVFKVSAELSCGGSVRPTYKADVSFEADRLKILAYFDFGMNENSIDYTLFNRECCLQSFVRGAFLACGNINDPEKEYRAEFNVKNLGLAEELKSLLSKQGIEMKIVSRGKGGQLYTKESGVVEDLLTFIGAGRKTLDIIDTKILKGVKNNINRARNCDNANISKTVEASIKQRTAIDFLKKADRLYSLPQELLSAAILREKNPDATLKELCSISEEPLTVSGLNHRLKRIVEIYEEIKNNKK